LATAVELIRGREIVDRQRVEVLARGGQRLEDGAAEALAGPVGADGRTEIRGHEILRGLEPGSPHADTIGRPVRRVLRALAPHPVDLRVRRLRPRCRVARMLGDLRGPLARGVGPGLVLRGGGPGEAQDSLLRFPVAGRDVGGVRNVGEREAGRAEEAGGQQDRGRQRRRERYTRVRAWLHGRLRLSLAARRSEPGGVLPVSAPSPAWSSLVQRLVLKLY